MKYADAQRLQTAIMDTQARREVTHTLQTLTGVMLEVLHSISEKPAVVNSMPVGKYRLFLTDDGVLEITKAEPEAA